MGGIAPWENKSKETKRGKASRLSYFPDNKIAKWYKWASLASLGNRYVDAKCDFSDHKTTM